MPITGTSGDDNLSGTTGDDVFNMTQGGNDTVTGLEGKDVFKFGTTFNGSDSIDGGAGKDKLVLDGDYSATVFLNSSILNNIENIALTAGNDYSLTFFDGVIGDGKTMKIRANTFDAGDTLTIDGGSMTAASDTTKLVLKTGKGQTFFTAGAGDNVLIGGSGADTMYFGGNFDAQDSLNGGTGAGANILQLTGDYSAGLTITGSMMKNFQYLFLNTGGSYDLTLADDVVAAGKSLTIQTGLLSTETLTLDCSQELDGSLTAYTGAGDDSLLMSGRADFVFANGGGDDDIQMGGGGDTVNMFETLTAAEHVDGGSGNDEIDLSGDYSAGITLTATTIVNFETLFLNFGNSYTITADDGTVAAGKSLVVTGSFGAGNVLIFDASAETDGTYFIAAGEEDDTLIGGQAGNTFIGDLGQDTMTAGAGADVFRYFLDGSALESTGSARDFITGFDGVADTFDVVDLPGAVNAAVTSGQMRSGHFDDDLAAAVGAGQLGVGNAVLFTPDSGNLSGKAFVVVDMNGTAGYQAGADLVVQLNGATNLGSFDGHNFI